MYTFLGIILDVAATVQISIQLLGHCNYFVPICDDIALLDFITERGSSSEKIVIPPVTTEEVKKALDEMQGGKAPGEDQITADL